MVVALRALNREAQDAFADAVHSVEHCFHAELLRIDATLLIEHGVAEKPGGEDGLLAV